MNYVGQSVQYQIMVGAKGFIIKNVFATAEKRGPGLLKEREGGIEERSSSELG